MPKVVLLGEASFHQASRLFSSQGHTKRTTEQINQNSPQRTRRGKPPVADRANFPPTHPIPPPPTRAPLLSPAQPLVKPVRTASSTTSPCVRTASVRQKTKSREIVSFRPLLLLKIINIHLKERGREWGAERALFANCL